MLVVSNDIKNAYNQYTTQRKSKIKIGNNEYFIQNMVLFADAYDEGNIVGNTIAKTLTFNIETEYVSGLDEFELYDGIWTGEEYEYINLGTFKLFEEQGVDDFFSSVTAYDKLVLFNKIYDSVSTEYPTTVYGLLENICNQAGVILGTESIANGLQPLNGNVFVEGETLKDVLKAICQISGRFAVISNDVLVLKLQGSDNLTLSKYQISSPEYKRTTWKWNQVVLGMQDIIGEHVLKQDDEDVELHGVHRLVINNNPFVYTQDLRQQYIDELFDAIDGFGYVSFETNWEGLPYVELGDTLTIDGYESIVLRYEIKSPNGLNSFLQAPSIIDSVIDYVNNTDDINNKQRRTEYRVDKAEGTITQLTQTTTNINDNLNNNYYTMTQTNELIQTAETGLTNTFSEAGGNNIFRNTGLWFAGTSTEQTLFPSGSIYPNDELFMGNKVIYEFWNGDVKKGNNDKAVNMTSLILLSGNLNQEQKVPNGNYVVSFKYKKLIELSNPKVRINDVEYLLNNIEDTEFVEIIEVSSQYINIQFITDIDKSCEIYDLMVNTGKTKLAYSQNQNETTTDTVNISKGITITSSNTDTIFKANADGIRTLDRSGNELTKFTDTGMTTKKMIVQDTSQIVKTLWQEVGDQTWITRL